MQAPLAIKTSAISACVRDRKCNKAAENTMAGMCACMSEMVTLNETNAQRSDINNTKCISACGHTDSGNSSF